uniref:Uncharacterized protein n=1 Tax=Anguilla anguilla TaxID=7936 RepID=A0A0E9RI45_ANGAN
MAALKIQSCESIEISQCARWRGISKQLRTLLKMVLL